MKPVIVKTDENGNIKVTLEELERIVDDAYTQGYNDGARSTLNTPPYTPVQPWWSEVTTCEVNK